MSAQPIDDLPSNARVYYVISDEETCCTSNRIYAGSIIATWIRRGYHNIESIVAAQVDDHIEQVPS